MNSTSKVSPSYAKKDLKKSKFNIIILFCLAMPFVLLSLDFNTKLHAEETERATDKRDYSFFTLHFSAEDQSLSVKIPKYQEFYMGLYYKHLGLDEQGGAFALKKIGIDDADEFGDSNSNRKMALLYSKSIIKYIFFVYDENTKERMALPGGLFSSHLDGVSNLIYNVSYLFSIPSKLIHGTTAVLAPTNETERSRFSDWLDLLLSLLIGAILVTFMIPFGAIIGTIFHPLQTLANITFISLKINIVSSLWDLVFGAMVSPLLDIFTLFGVYWGILKSIF